MRGASMVTSLFSVNRLSSCPAVARPFDHVCLYLHLNGVPQPKGAVANDPVEEQGTVIVERGKTRLGDGGQLVREIEYRLEVLVSLSQHEMATSYAQ
jgi:hypothetical protein